MFDSLSEIYRFVTMVTTCVVVGYRCRLKAAPRQLDASPPQKKTGRVYDRLQLGAEGHVVIWKTEFQRKKWLKWKQDGENNRVAEKLDVRLICVCVDSWMHSVCLCSVSGWSYLKNANIIQQKAALKLNCTSRIQSSTSPNDHKLNFQLQPKLNSLFSLLEA